MSDTYDGPGTGEPEDATAQIPPAPIEDPPTRVGPPTFSNEPPAPPFPPPTGAPTPSYPVASPGGAFGSSGPGGGYPPSGGAGYVPPPGGSGSWPSGWAQPNPGWAAPRPPQRKGPGTTVIAVALVLAALLLIAAGVGVGHGLWTSASSPASSTGPTGGSSPNTHQPSSSNNPGSGAPSDVSAIASKVDPGLVDINTTLSYQQEQAAGTGMVLTSNGEVLTNNHVIDGATSISVTDVGNKQTYTATVVGYDISHDLAVLQLHGASGLQTVSIGNSANVSVGQSVVGIGNAGGTGGTPSAAGGSVTALDQSITASDEGDGTTEQLTNLIESNADIQPGDSGGPLVNTAGQVLGIDTAASSGYSFQGSGGSGGSGYSIPINGAITIAKQIESGQASSSIHIGLTAFLGVEVQPASSGGFGGGFGEGGGGGTTQQTGVAVAGVLTGEPADEAGISTGDYITSFDGTTVDTPSALTTAIIPHHPGDKVQVAWTDTSGQSHTATVELASGPPA